MAYDASREAMPGRAAKEQLKILGLAARENESLADDALRASLGTAQPATAQAAVDGMERHEPAWPVTGV
jgi:hypothetical protein